MKTKEEIKVENFLRRRITKKFEVDGIGFYSIKFNTHNAVVNFFKKYKDKAYERNFYFNPYEQFAFAKFKVGNIEITINAPLAYNGDNNWYSYRENYGFSSEVKISFK